MMTSLPVRSPIVCAGLLLFTSWFPMSASADSPEPTHLIRKILFGSCIKHESPMPILDTMLGEVPDLILFLGDNVYADTEDMSEMRACYDRLAENQAFANLRARYPIMATWDDHDYGVNDGGADFSQREASKQEFLRFWRVPQTSPLRSRDGIYDSAIIGPEGQRVQLILLDTRFFRSPLARGEKRRIGGPYIPDDDPSKTLLGDAQWTWLEEQLRKPAELRVICSSIQCLPEAQGQETWSNLPRERARLFKLIENTDADGVVLLSGDRHWAELSRLEQDVPYPLYEMTSSSLNQIHARGTPTENRHRADDRTYHRENYGVLRIDWSDDPTVTLEIKDREGGVQIETAFPLSRIQHSSPNP